MNSNYKKVLFDCAEANNTILNLKQELQSSRSEAVIDTKENVLSNIKVVNMQDELNAKTKVIESLHEENFVLEKQVETLEEHVKRQKVVNSDLKARNKTIEQVAKNLNVGLSKSFQDFILLKLT